MSHALNQNIEMIPQPQRPFKPTNPSWVTVLDQILVDLTKYTIHRTAAIGKVREPLHLAL